MPPAGGAILFRAGTLAVSSELKSSQVRDAQDFIELAIARIAEQIALGEERTARALETIAHLLERKDQSPALAAQSLPIAGADAETGSARLPAAHRNLDERMAEIVLRLGASQPSAEELKSSPAAAGERPRLDTSERGLADRAAEKGAGVERVCFVGTGPTARRNAAARAGR